MGEAARRKAAEAAWLSSLDEAEQTVVRAARGLGAVLPLDGACYRASLFLKLFLQQEHGIVVDTVIGFVNDGSDEIYASHAWLEFRNKRTDLTLCRPMRPELQQRGPLVIHGRVIAEGWPHYTYHLHRPSGGLRVIERMMLDPEARPVVGEQEKLHLRMMATAKSATLIRAYLDGAPDNLPYERIAASMRGR